MNIIAPHKTEDIQRDFSVYVGVLHQHTRDTTTKTQAMLLKYLCGFIFGISLLGCQTAIQGHAESKQDSIYSYRDICCDVVDTKDKLRVKILAYSIGCECGVLACASNYIGITDNNDTIRILVFCGTDSTIVKGQNYMVIPRSVVSDHISVNIPLIWEQNRNDISVAPLFDGRLKTVWGSIVPIE